MSKVDIKRVYVYQELYDEVIKYAKMRRKRDGYFKSPNSKANFPFFLCEYIKERKQTF